MGYNNIYLAIRGEIKRDTGKAILVEMVNPESGETLSEWLPKSQLKGISIIPDGSGKSVIQASEWILKQKNWMAFATATPPAVSLSSSSVTTPANHPAPPTSPPARNWMDDMDDDVPY